MPKKDKMKINSVSVSDIYNQIIFQEAIHDKMSLSELAEEMEVRGLNPNIYSEKAFLNLILNLVGNYEGRRISLKEVKIGLDDSIKKKSLQKWGENLIVTKLFLDYIEKFGKDCFKVDVTRLEDEKTSKKISLVCPYCENIDVQIEPKKTESEYTCPKCNKIFLGIVGTVRGARGLGGYVAHQVVIRIKNIEGGESTISYYSSYTGLEVRSGDLIAAVYKKGWLSGG